MLSTANGKNNRNCRRTGWTREGLHWPPSLGHLRVGPTLRALFKMSLGACVSVSTLPYTLYLPASLSSPFLCIASFSDKFSPHGSRMAPSRPGGPGFYYVMAGEERERMRKKKKGIFPHYSSKNPRGDSDWSCLSLG